MRKTDVRTLGILLTWVMVFVPIGSMQAAVVQKRYYAREAVHDKYGVIAPWYNGQNGQLDYRVRIAAETLKRYPWTDASRSAAPLPEYMYSSFWNVDKEGNITVPPMENWPNGDLGQRSAYVLSGLVDYYAYSGDPAAIAHVTLLANHLLDRCQTPDTHPWPKFLISVPNRGKPYYDCDPKGYIQLDITAEVGIGLLRAYQLVGEKRWLEAAKHWGDLFAEKIDPTPGKSPWPRYANPEDVEWGDNGQRAGVAFELYFLDELIRLGYKGKNGAIVRARDIARAYLRDTLLPKWIVNDTFGINYWDWPSEVQLENVTEFACRYMMDNKHYFPNWKNDVRNVLSLFFNRTSVDPASNGEVYSGAWAYPESSSCCGRSLWYPPMELSWPFAQYAVEAESEWAREIARRSMILATYDIHETGYSEDCIDGGPIVNATWFKIAHPMALKHCLQVIGWLPELFAPSRENHIVRTTSVVKHVSYRKGLVDYTTFDAPSNTKTVLRLSFIPRGVIAGDRRLGIRPKLDANGYSLYKLANGDCIVIIRHDGHTRVKITGDDPAKSIAKPDLKFYGTWARCSLRCIAWSGHCAEINGARVLGEFFGNQIRVVGAVGPDGGLADVYIDGKKQLVGIDCWNPAFRADGILYYKNGLSQGLHTIEIVVRGRNNPLSSGAKVYFSSFDYSDALGDTGFGEGGGPTGPQRWIFGYPKNLDYKDSAGNLWRPATEFVVRLGASADSVAQAWRTTPVNTVSGTDAELYRYGVYAPEIIANFTVGPGRYHVRIKLAATRGVDTKSAPMTIIVNGNPFVRNLDTAATAGGANKPVDLVVNGVRPRNGIIEVRFIGAITGQGECLTRQNAFVQAIEVAPGDGGKGAVPRTVKLADETPNLLQNGGFEDGLTGDYGANGKRTASSGWNYEFISPLTSYIWPESAYIWHPDWGLPEIHCGLQAIRTHSDGNGHTRIWQDVMVKFQTQYQASVWVRPVDLRGKGFGTDPNDSAGLIIQELDADDRVIVEHPKIEIKKAAPYTKLSNTFITGAKTVKVRFILDTVIACHYTEGHVTYDDCLLTEVGN